MKWREVVNLKLPVHFLIHGWHDGKDNRDAFEFNATNVNRSDPGLWMEDTAKEWAKRANSNVCIIDWSFIAKANYLVATTSMAHVSEDIFDALMKLRSLGVNISQSAIAGHSLGAHIAGQVGKRLNRHEIQLGSIYGKLKTLICLK